MSVFPLNHDNDMQCPHCMLAKRINEFRESPECKAFVIDNYESSRHLKKYSEDEVAAAGCIQGMASLVGELMGYMAPSTAMVFLKTYEAALMRGREIGESRRLEDEARKAKH